MELAGSLLQLLTVSPFAEMRPVDLVSNQAAAFLLRPSVLCLHMCLILSFDTDVVLCRPRSSLVQRSAWWNLGNRFLLASGASLNLLGMMGKKRVHVTTSLCVLLSTPRLSSL
jgi:hypothetical protein